MSIPISLIQCEIEDLILDDDDVYRIVIETLALAVRDSVKPIALGPDEFPDEIKQDARDWLSGTGSDWAELLGFRPCNLMEWLEIGCPKIETTDW